MPRIADIDDDDEVTGLALVEVLHRCLALGQRGDEVGLRGLLVGVELARTDPTTLAEPGVDDHAVEATEVDDRLLEHGEDLVVVVDVQGVHDDLNVGVGGQQLVPQSLQPVDPAGRQCEVVTLGRQDPRHAGAEARARAGDEDVLAHDVSPSWPS